MYVWSVQKTGTKKSHANVPLSDAKWSQVKFNEAEWIQLMLNEAKATRLNPKKYKMYHELNLSETK